MEIKLDILQVVPHAPLRIYKKRKLHTEISNKRRRHGAAATIIDIILKLAQRWLKKFSPLKNEK